MTRLQKFAGAAAALALFVYVMSCRPAWSPDSKQVAFGFATEKGSGMALFNVETGKSESVFVLPDKMEDCLVQPVWRGGKLVILCYVDEKRNGKENNVILIMECNPETHEIREIATHEVPGDGPSPVVPPVVDDTGNIWLSGIEEGCSLLKIHPDGKTMEKVGPEKLVVLARGGDRFFYATVPDDDQEAPREKRNLEVGLFDPAISNFERHYSHLDSIAMRTDHDESDTKWQGPGKNDVIKTIRPSIAAAPDGSSCCVTVEFEGGPHRLLWCYFGKKEDEAVTNDSDIKITFSGMTSWTDLDNYVTAAGSSAFDSDGTILWTVGLKPKKVSSDDLEIVLMKSLTIGSLVLDRKVLPFDEAIELDDDMTIGLQPTISPDGRWLAVGTYPYKQTVSCPLAVVDLQSNDLDCRIVAPPVLATGVTGEEDG